MAIADVAPIDLLIQRADRPRRPGKAQVVVAEPEPLMLIARARRPMTAHRTTPT
jgi:CRISPR/Cas system-associated endonuclease/helicase Cas3